MAPAFHPACPQWRIPTGYAAYHPVAEKPGGAEIARHDQNRAIQLAGAKLGARDLPDN